MRYPAALFPTLFLSALLLTTLFLIAAPAYARVQSPPTAVGPDIRSVLASADTAEAEGNASFERQDWTQAALFYETAWNANRKGAGRSSPRAARSAFYLALALRNGGDTVGAAEIRAQAMAERARAPGGGGIELADLWRLEALAHPTDPAAAAEAWGQAYDLYRLAPGQAERTIEAAGTMGELLGRANRAAEGLAFAEIAVAAASALGRADVHAATLAQRGRIKGGDGDPVGAEADFQAALALQNPPDPYTLDGLAEVVMKQGRYDEADQILARAIAGWDAMGPLARSALAGSIAQQGWMRTEQDRLTEAEDLFRQSIAVGQSAGDADQAAFSSAGLGWNLHLQKRYAEAEPLLRQATLDIRRIEGVETRNHAAAITNLAGDLQAQGRDAEALVEFRRAYDVYGRTIGLDHPDIGWTLNAMARSAAVEDPASADALFRQGLEKAALLTPGHPEASERAGDYSRYLISVGREREALSLLRNARQAALNRPGGARGAAAQHRSERVRALFRLQVEAAWVNAGA